MFDLGMMELLVIGIVALIVIGPKDLPGMFRTVGNFVGRMKGMAREFQRSMDQAARDSGMDEATKGMRDVKSSLDSATKFNPLDFDAEHGNSQMGDLKKPDDQPVEKAAKKPAVKKPASKAAKKPAKKATKKPAAKASDTPSAEST